MRGLGLVLVVAAACSSPSPAKPDAVGPDVTPDPVDWVDFGRVSDALAITGIEQEIDLAVTASALTGGPAVELNINDTAFVPMTLGTAAIAHVAPDDTLQFRVTGSVGDRASIAITNVSDGDAAIDTTAGRVSSLVTGGGTTVSPYTAPDPIPSCRDYLAGYPEQLNKDGIYRIAPGGTMLTGYCDMTADGGGWTLVARVLATSTTHTTAAALDVLVDPTQVTTAKLADATINKIAFTRERLAITGVGTVYAKRTAVSFGTTAFSVASAAASSLNGTYSATFATAISCAADCGVSYAVQTLGFGTICGYRYYAAVGVPRAGMGCKANFGKAGTAWVK